MYPAKNRKKIAKLQKKEAQAKAKKWIRKTKKCCAIIATILPQMDEPKEQHPCIPVQVETLDRVRATLVNSSVCYNVITSKFFHTLENVKLIHEATTAQSFIGCMAIFVEKVFLHIQVG